MAIDWQQIPAQQPVPGVLTRRTDGEQMTIFHYEIAPGATFPLHYHPEEQLVVVLSGSVTFTAGEQQWELLPNMSALINAHLPHGARAGADGVQFLNILAPRRVGNTMQYVGQ